MWPCWGCPTGFDELFLLVLRSSACLGVPQWSPEFPGETIPRAAPRSPATAVRQDPIPIFHRVGRARPSGLLTRQKSPALTGRSQQNKCESLSDQAGRSRQRGPRLRNGICKCLPGQMMTNQLHTLQSVKTPIFARLRRVKPTGPPAWSWRTDLGNGSRSRRVQVGPDPSTESCMKSSSLFAWQALLPRLQSSPPPDCREGEAQFPPQTLHPAPRQAWLQYCSGRDVPESPAAGGGVRSWRLTRFPSRRRTLSRGPKLVCFPQRRSIQKASRGCL